MAVEYSEEIAEQIKAVLAAVWPKVNSSTGVLEGVTSLPQLVRGVIPAADRSRQAYVKNQLVALTSIISVGPSDGEGGSWHYSLDRERLQRAIERFGVEVETSAVVDVSGSQADTSVTIETPAVSDDATSPEERVWVTVDFIERMEAKLKRLKEDANKIGELNERIAGLNEQIVDLKDLNRDLEKENGRLQYEVERLDGLVPKNDPELLALIESLLAD